MDHDNRKHWVAGKNAADGKKDTYPNHKCEISMNKSAIVCFCCTKGSFYAVRVLGQSFSKPAMAAVEEVLRCHCSVAVQVDGASPAPVFLISADDTNDTIWMRIGSDMMWHDATLRQAPAKGQAQQRVWAACSAALHRRCGASPGLHAHDPIDQSHFPQRHDHEDLRGKARRTRKVAEWTRADPMFRFRMV